MVDKVTNEIVLGIAAKINEIYNNQYPIYTDNDEQGLEKPCFFIKVLDGEEKREIGLQDRYYRNLLNIVVIGYTINGKTEILNDMIDNLYELEYIELSDNTKIRADKLHPKIEEGILHFFIDYVLFIKKANDPVDEMDNYSLDEEVKNEES